MIGKYAWEFSENAENWNNPTFDTIEECIQEAKEVMKHDWHKKQDVIYIGETNPFSPMVDGASLIEHLEEQAFDECGEYAEDWQPWLDLRQRDGEENARKAFSELDTMLTQVVNGWLAKYNLQPQFYLVENIREVRIDG